MKKLIAVFLSTLLFCLASGTAFADDEEDFFDSGVDLFSICNHDYSSLNLVNSETGEIGPFDTSSVPANLQPVLQRMAEVGLDNCIVFAEHGLRFIQFFVPIANVEYDYRPEDFVLVATSANFKFLRPTRDLTYMYLSFYSTTGKYANGSLSYPFSKTSLMLAHLLYAKPLLSTGYVESGECDVWEAFQKNPDFPKITFDVDITPPTPFHNLTINYIHTNGQEAAPAYSAELEEGESYSIPSPAVSGYAPDRPTVAGTMGTEDILETVIYNPDSPEVEPPEPGTAGTVTVRYLYEDGSTAAPTKTQTLGPGQMFQILSPEVPGYSPTRKIIFGYTGSTELVFDVTYTQQTAASAGGIFFAPPDKQDGITWTPGGNGGITWQPNNGGGITFQPKQSGGIAFFPPKSIGAYPFDIPRRWSLWS